MDKNIIIKSEMLPKLPEHTLSKRDIAILVGAIVDQKGSDELHKFLNMKVLEKIATDYIERRKEDAKKDFLNNYGHGALKMEIAGALVELKSQHKRKLLKNDDYIFTRETQEKEREVVEMEELLKAKRESLKVMKLKEIRKGQATKVVLDEEIFGEETPPEEIDNYYLTVTLRDE